MSLDEVYIPKHSPILVEDAPVVINFLEHSERGPEVSIIDFGDEKTRGGYLVICSSNLKKYADKGIASKVIREMYRELDITCNAEDKIDSWDIVVQIMGKYLK